jgi:precorrin-6A/cobalt-precorrin-6A reductase
MILLVGGTSETAPISSELLRAGHRVLVSLATEAELELPDDPGLSVRRGRLDKAGFRGMIALHPIACVVDASHPFAGILRRELEEVCSELEIRRIRFERPELDPGPGIELVRSHEAAAASAVSHGRPVLLTTGSRYLGPYVDQARRARVALYARVLPGEESERACRRAGLPEANVEFARGPFSVAQTGDLLRRWGIGVLVAKNGGTASGLSERLDAARLEGVSVVLVCRPDPEPGAVTQVEDLVRRIGSGPR